VLPLFGPSSVRDGIGMGADVYLGVIHYMEPAVRNPMYIAQFISARSDLLGATNLLKQAALDPYSFVRDAYRQQRESLIRGSQGNNAPLPNYDEPGGGDGTGKPNDNGAPNYEDPGESGGAGAKGGAGGSGASNNGLPNYEDPGDASATAAASGAGAGAAAAVDIAGVAAAASAPAMASAPATASAPVAASSAGAMAVQAKPASAP